MDWRTVSSRVCVPSAGEEGDRLADSGRPLSVDDSLVPF